MIKVWIDYLKVVNGIIIPLIFKDDIYKLTDEVFDCFDVVVCIVFENTKYNHIYLTNELQNMV